MAQTQIVFKLCVAKGKYTSNGQEKTNWQQVGTMLKRDDGSCFILFDRSFNPAGIIPDEKFPQNLLIHCFPPDSTKNKRDSAVAKSYPQGQNQDFDRNFSYDNGGNPFM